MCRRRVAALLVSTLLVTMPVAAAEKASLPLATVLPALSDPLSADVAEVPPTPLRVDVAARPSLLPVMYASYATLQGYDAYSTLKAVKRGSVEANPMMSGIVGNPTAFFAVKGAVTVATIYAAETLWRSHHRMGAIALMAVTNGLMAIVAANNASTLSAQR